MSTPNNPLGILGIEFVEFSDPLPGRLEKIFCEFGFSQKLENPKKNIQLWEQNEIHFLVNRENGSFAEKFSQDHGPSIPSMGWKVENAQKAFSQALERGAKAPSQVDLFRNGKEIPAIYGIGSSLIYFVEVSDSSFERDRLYQEMGFVASPNPRLNPNKGFLNIDHLTNNVPQGTMQEWSDFYKKILGFTEVRYFDIRGIKTGLQSYALRSPCGTFSIPINEGTEAKSQINEYLEEYKGAGIQHLALTTHDILGSLKALEGTSIQTLDMDEEYYQEAFARVPQVTEDKNEIKKYNVLVDGDEEGYLLQIFTKNLIGPIFIEIIQRKNHFSFGEGNFGALFRSIERDQQKRGYLK